MIRLILPFPPSVNALYSGNHRRFKSKRYTDWIKDAAGAIATQPKFPAIVGPLEIYYRLSAPDNRRRDLFNYEKALSDFLVSHHVISDDSAIQRGIMEWAEDVGEGLVEVLIKTAENFR